MAIGIPPSGWLISTFAALSKAESLSIDIYAPTSESRFSISSIKFEIASTGEIEPLI